jgi:hypothetical protein
MKTTKELIIADITAKVEAKLASQKVELGLVDDIKSDVSANGKSADIARPLILQASTSLSKAYENLLNIKKRNEVIIKNSEVFKSKLKELGIEPTDQFQKNIVANLFVDKNIDAKIKAILTATSSLKNAEL